jgi:hypothetical protein
MFRVSGFTVKELLLAMEAIEASQREPIAMRLKCWRGNVFLVEESS